jgi:hypothetical protein
LVNWIRFRKIPLRRGFETRAIFLKYEVHS